MKTVVITNTRPIKRLEMSIEPGELLVLRGRNGTGKSHALNAVAALVSGKGSLEVRDGTLKGSVEGFGAKITVAKSTRRSGVLEVTGLEGKLAVASDDEEVVAEVEV